MGPNPESVKMAIGALRKGGRVWFEQEGPLLDASRAVEELTLRRLEMGIFTGFYPTYLEICTGMQQLAKEASGEMVRMGDALTKAADAYQREEDEGVHKLKGVW
jgi:GMP synthase-like glutamine amidotransferase